jgi:hypothetical protein
LRTADFVLYELSNERSKEDRMKGNTSSRRGMVALAALVMLALVAPVYAQTQGMDRRDDRRDDRAGGRAAKQACKAGDEKTRAECRQVKRTTKHGGTQEGQAAQAPAAPATPPPQ